MTLCSACVMKLALKWSLEMKIAQSAAVACGEAVPGRVSSIMSIIYIYCIMNDALVILKGQYSDDSTYSNSFALMFPCHQVVEIVFVNVMKIS